MVSKVGFPPPADDVGTMLASGWLSPCKRMPPLRRGGAAGEVPQFFWGRRAVGEIQAKTEAENKEKGRQPMGVAAILPQVPHSKPAGTDGRKVHGRKVPGTYCAAGRCQEPIVHGRKVPGTYCAAGRCPCRAGRCQEPIVREPIVRHLRSPSVRLKMVLQVIAFAVPEPSSKPPAKHWHRPRRAVG